MINSGLKHCMHPEIKHGPKAMWHHKCLVSVNWSKYTFCIVCTYILWCKQFQFQKSKNKFIHKMDNKDVYEKLKEAIPVARCMINDETWICWLDKMHTMGGTDDEYYFFERELFIFALQTTRDPLQLKAACITWLNEFGSSA